MSWRRHIGVGEEEKEEFILKQVRAWGQKREREDRTGEGEGRRGENQRASNARSLALQPQSVS
jgi:hypothetical protein